MMRRAGILVVAALFAALAFADGAGAYQRPVTATGQIYCQISGKIRFSPKLVFGGTTPTVARYKATTGYCYSGSDFFDEPVAGITDAKLTGSFSLPTNECGGVVRGGPNTFTAKWHASDHRVVSTKVQLADVNLTIVDGSIDDPLLSSNGAISTTGSFPGTVAGAMYATMFAPAGDEATLCQPKSKSVPGSGGLKTLEVGGGDSFFVLEDGTPPSNP